ncbi:MAG TPA: ribosome recycling factor [Firmicutes bacterium]|nr:ribosome recycling factor [Bacillota bacterium]
MTGEILKSAEEKMKKAIDIMAKEFKSLRAGRATPAILDKINVEYYGVATPLNQIANITAPEARLLIIQPWDKNIVGDIEKAILKSDLGLTPNSDGTIIRLVIPELTQERRKELVKLVRRKAEETKVAIRNIRRETNDSIKEEEKKKEVSEDECHRLLDEVQKLTDKMIKEADNVLALKEKELMEI